MLSASLTGASPFSVRPAPCAAALALLLVVALSPATGRSEPAAENGWGVSGMILTGLGAGTMSAVATPIVVGALSRVVGEGSGPPFGEHVDPSVVQASLVGGAVVLALGATLWAQGTRQQRAHARRTKPSNPGMRKAGIALTASGLGLGGLAVALAYMPGNCNDSQPPDCTYPSRDVAAVVAITGVAAVGVGIPLWIGGGAKVTAEDAPAVSLVATPRELAFRGRF